MNIDKDRFTRTLLDSSIHKRLRSSLLPGDPSDMPKNRKLFVEDLYQQVVSGEYFPSIPRGFICSNKYRGVTRIVPVLCYKDSCIYYFCLKQIEKYIAINRTEGTFGGWQLGNPIAEDEKLEQRRIEEEFEADAFHGPYGPTGGYNPGKWFEQWSEFQKITFLWDQRPKNTSFIEFDIANFYDNINLDLLERKIRLLVTTDLSPVVDLLFVLLRNWNRSLEGYGPKTVGIPQDEISDCSRILANFYLQDYDRALANDCRAENVDYVRYADDQIYMGSDPSVMRKLIHRASVELHRIGLNINSGKVKEFTSYRAFYDHWGFQYLEDLSDPSNKEAINRAFEAFVCRMPASADDNSWRWFTILKWLLGIGFSSADPEHRQLLVEFLLQEDVVSRLDHRTLRKLQKLLTLPEIRTLNKIIEQAIWSTPFNAFHFHILKYYDRGITDRQRQAIEARIEEIGKSLA